ncbi:MAG: hypothetical protein AB7P21_04170 [Lautropia sp.]
MTRSAGCGHARCGRSPAPDLSRSDIMFQAILWIVGIIFVIGLLVVTGVFKLIF